VTSTVPECPGTPWGDSKFRCVATAPTGILLKMVAVFMVLVCDSNVTGRRVA
jgi:hypothetical protein